MQTGLGWAGLQHPSLLLEFYHAPSVFSPRRRTDPKIHFTPQGKQERQWRFYYIYFILCWVWVLAPAYMAWIVRCNYGCLSARITLTFTMAAALKSDCPKLNVTQLRRGFMFQSCHNSLRLLHILSELCIFNLHWITAASTRNTRLRCESVIVLLSVYCTDNNNASLRIASDRLAHI